jgi:hypothetical protein
VLADFLGVHPADCGKVVKWSMDFSDYFNIVPITVENTNKMVSSGLELIYARSAEGMACPPGRRFSGNDDQGGRAGRYRGRRAGQQRNAALAGRTHAVRNFSGNAVWLFLNTPTNSENSKRILN